MAIDRLKSRFIVQVIHGFYTFISFEPPSAAWAASGLAGVCSAVDFLRGCPAQLGHLPAARVQQRLAQVCLRDPQRGQRQAKQIPQGVGGRARGDAPGHHEQQRGRWPAVGRRTDEPGPSSGASRRCKRRTPIFYRRLGPILFRRSGRKGRSARIAALDTGWWWWTETFGAHTPQCMQAASGVWAQPAPRTCAI